MARIRHGPRSDFRSLEVFLAAGLLISRSSLANPLSDDPSPGGCLPAARDALVPFDENPDLDFISQSKEWKKTSPARLDESELGRRMEVDPYSGQANYQDGIERFLEWGMRRRALFRLAELGHFQKRLNSFYDEMTPGLKAGKVRTLKLPNGSKVEVSLAETIHPSFHGKNLKSKWTEPLSWCSGRTLPPLERWIL